MIVPVHDQRGFAERLKRRGPGGLFRRLAAEYDGLLSRLPYGLKYPLGGMLRRGRAPYCFLEDGDVAVQVGAPRDILHVGRSRAIHFARLVGTGKVVVVEPDAENCEALRRFVQQVGLERQVVLFECGAWHTTTTLTTLPGDPHTAANVIAGVHEIAGVQKIGEATQHEGACRKIEVPVRSLDDMLAAAGLSHPKLVSIATNGSELQVVAGMRRTINSGCCYISLASSGDSTIEQMRQHGYEYIVRDDVGYCFRQLAMVSEESQPLLAPS